MDANREILEDLLERNETQLKGLRDVGAELKRTTDGHGTDREHFEEDLLEAGHNISFYEGEVERIKKELGPSGGARDETPAGGGRVGPRPSAASCRRR